MYSNFKFNPERQKQLIDEFENAIEALQVLSDELKTNIDTILEPNWNTQSGKELIKDLRQFNDEQLRASFITMFLMNKKAGLDTALQESIKINLA